MTTSIIPYPGGKYRECKWLYDEFPDPNSYERYAEVFGGGGVVLLNRTKHEDQSEVINDINSNLTNLMRVIRDRPHELHDWLQNTPYSRELQAQYSQALQNETTRKILPNLKRAGMTFMSYRSSFSGDITSTFATPSIERNNHMSYYNAIENVEDLSERLQGVIIECLDWTELLNKYDSPEVFFYLDPPYPKNGQLCNGEQFDHEQLQEQLQDLEAEWALSYDRIPDWATNQNISSKDGRSTFKNTQEKIREEILIKSY